MQLPATELGGTGSRQSMTPSDVADSLLMSAKCPVVSVVIPAFNRNETLPRALMSVVKQTFQQFEIIIIDDGSVQPVEQVVSSLGYPRIRLLVHPKNRGANAARNTGIGAATGKYVAFLDSDDEWHPDKLQIQVAAMEAAPSSVAGHYTGFSKFSNTGAKIAQRSRELSGNILPHLLRRNENGPLSSVLVRRDVVSEVGLLDESLPSSQDWDLYLRIAERYEFASVGDSLLRYHAGSDSITLNPKAKVLGRKMILEKYEARVACFPADFATQLVIVGHYHCRTGALAEGRQFFAKRFVSAPFRSVRICSRLFHFLG